MKIPELVGVPVMTPLADRLSPGGIDVADHNTMPAPPVAVSVWLYGVPTMAVGRMLSSWMKIPEILSVYVRVMTTLVPLLTFSTNENVPAFVGVPTIAPAGSRKSPGGNPDVGDKDHVVAPVLSNASNVRE